MNQWLSMELVASSNKQQDGQHYLLLVKMKPGANTSTE